MLILSRSEGDVIHIGDGVRLVVLSCDRKGVRLGIDAPRDVRILRGEIVVD
ncbi:carbon storage regulator, partial [bacterium]|nr:carbon storage regulator [bacterium]